MPRAPRRCRHRDCDELQPCPDHRRAPDTRPPSSQRGYDADFDQLKKTDPEYLAATHCPTCGHEFKKDGPFQKTAGHRKDIRAGGTSVEGIFAQCARCNYGWKRGKKLAGAAKQARR